jgi:lysylphosphatidylglycerol synthetase-like protein (DUF2156 family)/UDP-2,3-diacylglucosamine pyrophosphatase LpxH
VPDTSSHDLPAGARVLVVTDLHLGLSSDTTSEMASAALARELADWSGAGLVVLAGDCFELLAEPNLDPARCLAAHPRLAHALETFAQGPERHVVVLPGNHDGCLAWHEPSVNSLRRRTGAEVALAVEVAADTGAGTRRVRIEHGNRFDPVNAVDDPRNPAETPLGHHVVRELLPVLRRPEAGWLDGIDLLTDLGDAPSFFASRLVYRRLVRRFGWLVLPLLVAIALLVVSSLLHLTAHHGSGRALRDWAAGFGLAGVALPAVVALVTALWWWSLRGPFRGMTLDDLTGAEHHQNDAARAAATRLRAEGYAGFITGHTHEPELTDLGGGAFYANAGCGAEVVERRAPRFGVLPAYGTARLLSWVELEAGNELHVRLHCGRRDLGSLTRLERWATRPPATNLPGTEIDVVASWPEGKAWPPPEPHGLERKRARRIGAFALAVVGLIDVVSSVTPPLRVRIHAVTDIVPLQVSQAAAFLVVLIGLGLLLLARGVRRGQRFAWLAAQGLLWSSFALHVLKGLDLEEAIVTATLATFLLVNQRHFRVRSSEGQSLRGLLVLLAGLVVALVTGTLAVESLHGRSQRPGWGTAVKAVAERMVGITTVPLPDRLDDFLSPSLVAVTAGLAVYVGWLLFRPVMAHRLKPTAPEAAENARRIVATYGGDTLAYFALRSDKRWFFWGDTVVAYAVSNGVALVSPDPVGPLAERRRAWFAFRQFADDHGWPIAVMGASEDWLPIYHSTGMRDMYVGDEAVVDVRRFNLEGGKNKGLRQAVNRVAKYGYSMEFCDPTAVSPELEAGLRALMAESRRGEMERGFSMTLGRVFDPADEGLLLAVCFGPGGEPVAFCQFVPAPAINGYSLDLMRRSEGEHPNGLTDFVVVETIRHLRATGMVGLGLNFATMRAVMAGERGAGLTGRMERWVFSRMSDSMQIESLWRYNEKFDPDWVPRYACYDSVEHLPSAAAALAKAESWWEIPVVGRFFVPAEVKDDKKQPDTERGAPQQASR